LYGLVSKKGFACLSFACLALAAGPAAAQEPDHTPPPQSQGEPPPFASEESTEQEAPPGQSAPAPEQQSEVDDGRVQIRSVTKPRPEPDTAPVPEDTAPPERPAPSERAGEWNGAVERGRTDSRERSAGSQAPPVTSVTVPPASEPQIETKRPDKTRSATAKRSESLPARIVPRPVREIAEVVPTGIWIVLAGLAILAAVIGAFSGIAAARARRLRRQRESLLKEVGLLQAALLPSVPPGLPVSVGYRPAADASVSGDFYDAFPLPSGGIGLAVGNVSGDGRDTLARTTFVRYTLRAHLDAGLEPREVLKVASDALAAHLDGGFATLIIAVYDPTTSRFTYASAGNPPPVVVGCDEDFDPVIACAAPPLGLCEPNGFRQSTFTLSAGARACLYTGVRDIDLLLAALEDNGDAQTLLDTIAETADGIEDDMAVCLVTAAPDAPATGLWFEELEVHDEHEVGDSLERFLRACGVALAEVPGILREAGEAARREGSVTVRVRMNDFRPGAEVMPGNLVRLAERRRAVR
jgi:hypothetical protein